MSQEKDHAFISKCEQKPVAPEGLLSGVLHMILFEKKLWFLIFLLYL